MQIAFYGVGSIYDVSGTNTSVHYVTEINSDVVQSPFTSGTSNVPKSFQLEDSKAAPGTGRNFVRKVRGAIPVTTTISASQGEKVNVSVDYVAQTVDFSSGTISTAGIQGHTPYLWSHASVNVAGSQLKTVKSAELTINQNTEGPHYLLGSRVITAPYQGNREYTFSITMDADADDLNLLYDDLYRVNGSFHAVFDLNADSTGSQHTIFTMSGCRIVSTPDIPSPFEGINEVTFELMPQSLSAVEYTSGAPLSKFNPW